MPRKFSLDEAAFQAWKATVCTSQDEVVHGITPDTGVPLCRWPSKRFLAAVGIAAISLVGLKIATLELGQTFNVPVSDVRRAVLPVKYVTECSDFETQSAIEAYTGHQLTCTTDVIQTYMHQTVPPSSLQY